MAVEHGLHVLLETPIAHKLSEADAIIQAAVERGLKIEVAEQFDWELPDAILYPAGGGVGLIGMWKAFAEMEALGWIGSKRPKMIAVQAEGCQPVVRAFEAGADNSEFYQNAATVAAGLRVPKPLGDALMLQAIRESKGCAVAVSDDDLLDGALELSSAEGMFAAPEGGACVAAVRSIQRLGRTAASRAAGRRSRSAMRT